MESAQTGQIKTVLCFGDSLTGGHNIQTEKYRRFVSYDPYSEALNSLLTQNSFAVQITTDGIDGDYASNMNFRLQKHLKQTQYDLVCILAGTNDLGTGKTQEKVLKYILDLHSICHQNGVKTIAISIPYFRSIMTPSYQIFLDARNFVNQQLQAFCQSKPDQAYFFDLCGLISIDQNENWSDNLHYSKKGYQMIGEEMGKFIINNKILLSQRVQ